MVFSAWLKLFLKKNYFQNVGKSKARAHIRRHRRPEEEEEECEYIWSDNEIRLDEIFLYFVLVFLLLFYYSVRDTEIRTDPCGTLHRCWLVSHCLISYKIKIDSHRIEIYSNIMILNKQLIYGTILLTDCYLHFTVRCLLLLFIFVLFIIVFSSII